MKAALKKFFGNRVVHFVISESIGLFATVILGQMFIFYMDLFVLGHASNWVTTITPEYCAAHQCNTGISQWITFLYCAIIGWMFFKTFMTHVENLIFKPLKWFVHRYLPLKKTEEEPEGPNDQIVVVAEYREREEDGQ